MVDDLLVHSTYAQDYVKTVVQVINRRRGHGIT